MYSDERVLWPFHSFLFNSKDVYLLVNLLKWNLFKVDELILTIRKFTGVCRM